MSEQTPSVGRVVHYMLMSGPGSGEHRPAMIVSVGGGYINLSVFLDSKDYGMVGERQAGALLFAEAVGYSKNPLPGTWHWPEQV